MLLSLLDASDFNVAMQPIRAAYLGGEYRANGEVLDIPFDSLFREFFKEGQWEGHLNHMCNVVGAMAYAVRYAESCMPELGEFTLLRRLNLMHLAFYHG